MCTHTLHAAEEKGDDKYKRKRELWRERGEGEKLCIWIVSSGCGDFQMGNIQ